MNRKKAIQALITLVILCFLFAKIGINPLMEIMRHAFSPGLILAVVFIVMQSLLLSWRWQRIVNDGAKRLTFNDALKMTAASNLANALLFTSLSGILVRVGMTMQKGLSAVKASYLSITDRMLTLLALLVVGVVFLPAALHELPGPYLNLFIGLTATFALCVPFGIWWALSGLNRQTINRHRRFFCALSHLRRLFWRRKMNGAVILLCSFLGQLCFFFAVYFLITANGGQVHILPLLAIVPVISIVSAFPVSIGGWGVREGAFVYGLQILSLPADIALATSIEVGILTTITAFFMYLITFSRGERPQDLFRFHQDARRSV